MMGFLATGGGCDDRQTDSVIVTLTFMYTAGCIKLDLLIMIWSYGDEPFIRLYKALISNITTCAFTHYKIINKNFRL